MSIKRNEFLKHLKKYNCRLLRNGAKHDVYVTEVSQTKTTIPLQPILEKITCMRICKQLEIPKF